MKMVLRWNMLLILGLVFLAACAGQAGEPPVEPTPAAPAEGLPTVPALTRPADLAPTVQQMATDAQQGTLPTSTPPSEPTAAGTTAGQEPAIPVTSTESAATPSAEAAIDCTAPAALTPAMTEGPYFTPGSPETKDLAGDLPGTKLHLSGYVLTADCQPVANAKIDFWQADAQGNYDNSGYTLRGHQFTAADGSYQLTTVVPGQYPGRTEHIHLKVQAPGGPELTTQLYFPGAAQNQSDRIFDPALLINVVSDQGEMTATYHFVVETQ